MSQSDHPDSPRPRSPPLGPLGIIHFLGWITGIAAVLAVYRGVLDAGWLDVSPDRFEEARWWQLGYGLAYGTALSTLGLLLYRRIRGDHRFPAAPGHWLLVFGGLAFLADAIAFGLAKGIVALWKVRFQSDPGWYHFQQSLVWGIALVGAVIVLARLQTTWNWWLVAVLVAALIAANWLNHSLCVIDHCAREFGRVPLGSVWPYYSAPWVQIVGLAVCLAAIPVAIGFDRQPRDWLHWVGIVATIFLALVEAASQATYVLRLG